MPEMKNDSSTGTATVQETSVNEQNRETVERDEADEAVKPMYGIKRLLLWAALILGSWAVVLGIAYLIYSGLKGHGTANPPAAAVVVSDDGRTVTVPAVRGVNAANCKTDELVVEGNRLVFKNGCAKPVFYGQDQ